MKNVPNPSSLESQSGSHPGKRPAGLTGWASIGRGGGEGEGGKTTLSVYLCYHSSSSSL